MILLFLCCIFIIHHSYSMELSGPKSLINLSCAAAFYCMKNSAREEKWSPEQITEQTKKNFAPLPDYIHKNLLEINEKFKKPTLTTFGKLNDYYAEKPLVFSDDNNVLITHQEKIFLSSFNKKMKLLGKTVLPTSIDCAAISPDSTIVAAAFRQESPVTKFQDPYYLIIYQLNPDLTEKYPTMSFKMISDPSRSPEYLPLRKIFFTPENNLLIPSDFCILSINTQEKTLIKYSTQQLIDVLYLPNYNAYVTSTLSSSCKINNIETNNSLKHFRPITSAGIRSCASTNSLVAITTDHNAYIFDINKDAGDELQTFIYDKEIIHKIALAPDTLHFALLAYCKEKNLNHITIWKRIEENLKPEKSFSISLENKIYEDAQLQWASDNQSLALIDSTQTIVIPLFPYFF